MSAVIIIDEMHPSIIESLESLGFGVDYHPDINRQQLQKVIGQYQGLIVRSKTTIDQQLLERADKLKFVGRAGAGVDNLDETAISAKGIHIINAPEGNRDSLGEHMVGMLLNLLHRISASHQAIRAGVWDREGFRGIELGDKTVGIIGCGNMGTAFARRLSGFGCTLLGYDKYLAMQKSKFYIRASLEELYSQCDIVSLHVPLTRETRNFYDYSFFRQFDNPIILLNSARGEVLPLDNLVQLLKEKKIVGAALDVFEKEPIMQLSDNQKDIYDYLTTSPYVLLTPHIAGWSHESYRRINDILITKIKHLKDTGAFD